MDVILMVMQMPVMDAGSRKACGPLSQATLRQPLVTIRSSGPG
ncbi:MAG: hypothetical protein Q8N10_14870 [Phenylobacterium sp.]|nr:hypothetical protein [Phenylobacterium sp.]